jgi:hypothetical protein
MLVSVACELCLDVTFFFREAYKMEYMDSTVYFVKNMLLPTMIRA